MLVCPQRKKCNRIQIYHDNREYMSNTLTDGEEEKVVFCSRSSVSPQPGSALRFTAGRFSVFSPFFSAVCVCASLAGLSDTSAPKCRTRQPGETTPCCSSFLPLKFLFLGRLCRHLLRWDVPRPHSPHWGGRDSPHGPIHTSKNHPSRAAQRLQQEVSHTGGRGGWRRRRRGAGGAEKSK